MLNRDLDVGVNVSYLTCCDVRNCVGVDLFAVGFACCSEQQTNAFYVVYFYFIHLNE